MAANHIFYGAYQDSYSRTIAYLSEFNLNSKTHGIIMTAYQLEVERYKMLPDDKILLIGRELYPKQSPETIEIKAEIAAPIPTEIQGFFVGTVYYDYFNTYVGPPHDHVIDVEQVQEHINYERKVCASADGYSIKTPRIIHMISPLLFQTISGEIYQITTTNIEEQVY